MSIFFRQKCDAFLYFDAYNVAKQSNNFRFACAFWVILMKNVGTCGRRCQTVNNHSMCECWWCDPIMLLLHADKMKSEVQSVSFVRVHYAGKKGSLYNWFWIKFSTFVFCVIVV